MENKEKGFMPYIPREYTKKEKLRNWFYYYKWWLAAGIIALFAIGSLLATTLGRTAPDYSFAYVGSTSLPDACVAALEESLATLGSDLNGDGKVAVSVTQHLSGDGENMAYGYTSDVALVADMMDGTSYFFLTDDPDYLQGTYRILAHPDGSMPDEEDTDGMSKVLLWSDCPVLAELASGLPEEYRQLLSELYLGRRFYYDPGACEYIDAYDNFWSVLTADNPS